MGMVLPEIRLLQAAIALAEELNFSRAAERLRIEQSTLSKRIVELESQIDLRLFERNHQVVALTEAGRHFVEDARSAVLYAERAVTGARAALHGADDVIHIGRSAGTDPYLVTMIQSIRLSLFPGLKVKLWSNFSHELARMVAAGKLDLALVTAIPDSPALSFLSVTEAPAILRCRKATPSPRTPNSTSRFAGARLDSSRAAHQPVYLRDDSGGRFRERNRCLPIRTPSQRPKRPRPSSWRTRARRF
jgi:DNA-binding transcriptional LysR family regulator